jgi:uncharacterized protein (DUF1501 family)
MLSRRRFLLLGGGLVASGAAGIAVWGTQDAPGHRSPVAPGPGTTGAPPPASENSQNRALVVVQLGGGNDGLNTLVPTDGRYHDARPTLAITDPLIPVPGTEAYGLHPAFAPMQPLLAAGHVALVQGIGYQHPDRSHFAASDAWWSATPGQSSTTGWLGRYLDATAQPDASPLRAVSLGGGTPALAADRARATSVYAPAAFKLQPPRASRSAALLDAWAATAPGAADARHAVDVFSKLDLSTPNQSAAPDPGAEGEGAGDITAALAIAAQLLAAGDGTQLVYVNTSGFDTHANQAATQKRLLADLATGIARFETSLAAAHLDDRVLLITVSEFGRRVAENGSAGTDHGKASVQLAVGPMVKGGVHGQIDLGRLDDGDVAAGIDTRSLYAAALEWLGGPADEVLGGRFDALGLVA